MVPVACVVRSALMDIFRYLNCPVAGRRLHVMLVLFCLPDLSLPLLQSPADLYRPSPQASQFADSFRAMSLCFVSVNVLADVMLNVSSGQNQYFYRSELGIKRAPVNSHATVSLVHDP